MFRRRSQHFHLRWLDRQADGAGLLICSRKESFLPELGTLEKVNLREVWQDEASQFTPWLRDNQIRQCMVIVPFA